jgi:hypothetical protein
MVNGSGGRDARKWRDSGHASLCALGVYLRQRDVLRPLLERVRIRQKALKYTPAQKLLMVLVAVLTGAKAVAHAGATLGVDPALQCAFGRPGGADQSVLAETLNAATDRDVADRRAAIDAIFREQSQARRHDCERALLVLDVDLSPLPTGARAEGADRAYMGRSRARRAQAGPRARRPRGRDRLGGGAARDDGRGAGAAPGGGRAGRAAARPGRRRRGGPGAARPDAGAAGQRVGAARPPSTGCWGAATR